jgi:hypothetical protein
MEADWEFEVGADAPVIEAYWAGFVDLRGKPERAHDLPETAQLPGFAAALQRLNSESSPVWTSKCDFWSTLEREEFDPDELDAPLGSAGHAISCFMDLLPKQEGEWAFPARAEAECRRLCTLLSSIPLRCCRVDFIIRRALVVPDVMDLGITACFTACGPGADQAKDTLEAALAAFARALCPESTLQ